MPEVGADSCCEDGPGWGSLALVMAEAHSDLNLLVASLHLEELRNPSVLNLGSRSVGNVNTLNDSRLEAVSVTRRCRCWCRCMAACVCKEEALCSSARQSIFIIGITFDPDTRLSSDNSTVAWWKGESTRSTSPMMVYSSAVSGVKSVFREARDTHTGSLSTCSLDSIS